MVYVCMGVREDPRWRTTVFVAGGVVVVIATLSEGGGMETRRTETAPIHKPRCRTGLLCSRWINRPDAYIRRCTPIYICVSKRKTVVRGQISVGSLVECAYIPPCCATRTDMHRAYMQHARKRTSPEEFRSFVHRQRRSMCKRTQKRGAYQITYRGDISVFAVCARFVWWKNGA